MMKRLTIVLGVAGAAFLLAMLYLPYLPATMSATASLGETVSVNVKGDGSSTVYTTHRLWDVDCRVTRPDGRPGGLRPDMLAQRLPGGWFPRGQLINSGELTIACDGPDGGRFAVGPTRSAGFLLIRGGLLLAGLTLLLTAGVMALVRWIARRPGAARG